MLVKNRSRSKSKFILSISFIVTLLVLSFVSVGARQQTRRTPSFIDKRASMSPTSLIVEDLTGSLTPQDLAQSLVGPGITISSVSYTGVDLATGSFSGGDGIVGFDKGIVLTSGSAINVVGPNVADNITGNNGLGGDPDLSELSGFTTFDATVLEFDFVPQNQTVFFRFVFASDEYNEYVNSNFNDVFAFFVNGTNCALVEGDPVTINSINYGNPYGNAPYSNPDLYINNDLQDGGPFLDTEMDGLTEVLTCSANVTPGETSHLKLAIADASDHSWDSAVFLEAESLTSASVVNLTGLEITQAIQDLNNDDVDMVKDKDTFVRAHVSSATGSTIFNVKAKLIGRRGGVPLPGSPLAPENLGGSVDVLSAPNRVQLTQSFYYRLPPSWSNGSVEVEFVGQSHQIDCQDVTNSDNDCKANVTFEDTPELKVSMIGIRWEDSGGTLHDPDLADYQAVAQDIRAQLPIPGLDWDRPYELDDWVVDGGPPDSDGDAWDLGDVLSRLSDKRNLDGKTDRIYYGLLVDYPSGADLGLGYRPGWASAGFYRSTDPTTGSHEIGHNLGRRHTNCSGSESGTGTFPYSDGHISEEDTGNDAFYGFNIFSQAILGPSTGDLMGYCRPRWVSDFTYDAMRTEIVSRWAPPLLAPEQMVPEQSGIYTLVGGSVGSVPISGELSRVFNVEASGPVLPQVSSVFSIVFEGSNGSVLAEYSFAPSLPEDGENIAGGFSFLLPYEPNAKRIVLFHNDNEIAVNSASANVPSVNITSPTSNSFWDDETETISWNASDADGDPLNYVVQYSSDGGENWTTLTSGYSGSSYQVNRAALGGSQNARVKVIASDGFYSSEDQSELFGVAENNPQVLIASPGTGAIFVEDQNIFLEGSAYDSEDGQLTGEALTWESSLDGALGVGELLVINAESLSEGVHTITFKGTDSSGDDASESVDIEVHVNRPDITPVMSVGPTSVNFITMVGEDTDQEHIISVDNAGDGTIEWTAVADSNWIQLSATTGFTPGEFKITTNADGLPEGEYEGIVTITGPGSQNSPLEIQVSLTVEGLPSVLSVGPTSVNFSTTVGEDPDQEHTISVDNTGGGTIEWTAVADSSWIELSATTGSTPSEFKITANASGLPIGEYDGVVTVTGSGSQNSPQEIDVSLIVEGLPFNYQFLPIIID